MQDQLPVVPENPRDTHSWTAYIAALYPDKVTLTDATDDERRDWNRKVRVYRLNPVVKRHAERAAGAQVIAFPKHRTAVARQRERRSRSGRSSARSGDSGSDDGSEPPAADRWRWASDASWRSFVASIHSRDFERDVHLERMAGWSR
jgi:hypothetical protein